MIEERWRSWTDLRSLVDIAILRDGRVQRLTGVLLLRAPASLRFEALSAFGPPVLLVAAAPDRVTIWEVLRNRAFVLPASPEANRRWLGLALDAEDLVGLLSGHVRPLRTPSGGVLLPPDGDGPSLSLSGPESTQRLWMDPATGVVRRVEYSRGSAPVRAAIEGAGPGEPPALVRIQSSDGTLQVTVRYRAPALDSGFDPELLRLTVPEGVEIQAFR